MSVQILLGNNMDTLKGIPSLSVQTVVTSPPYYGLRDYGMDGQLGLEKTPDEYVSKMVEVFREVWRVLKDDGVLWLNLGDSYWSSGERQTGRNDEGPIKNRRGGSVRGGVRTKINDRHAIAYDTSGKAQLDCQVNGCLCGNLCGVCRVVYQNHKFRKDGLLVAMLTASLSATIPAHTELQSGHSPTLHLVPRVARTSLAIQGQENFSSPADERLRVSLVSMIGVSSPQLLEECLQRASHGVCLLCAHSLVDYVQEFSDKTVCTCDTATRFSSFVDHNQSINRNVYPYLHSTTEYLKPKDLIGIPWMVAFALRADGWYLRSDIIWAKPNPMPESVKDRPTKSHEYIFLLSKSERYYYNADAIAEPSTWAGDPRAGYGRLNYRGKREGAQGTGQENFVHITETRNKRDVWTVNTKPYKGAHFATFNPALIEPCILAGSKEGDIVLDPFNGSGTTGEVAIKHNRSYIGCELNPDYVELAHKRLASVPRMFSLEPA